LSGVCSIRRSHLQCCVQGQGMGWGGVGWGGVGPRGRYVGGWDALCLPAPGLCLRSIMPECDTLGVGCMQGRLLVEVIPGVTPPEQQVLIHPGLH
jgi:hypothetical protein